MTFLAAPVNLLEQNASLLTLYRSHANRRSLVLHQARRVGRRDRPGQPDDLRVEVEPPQLEAVILGTAVPPTQVLYLKSGALMGQILLVHSDNMSNQMHFGVKSYCGIKSNVDETHPNNIFKAFK